MSKRNRDYSNHRQRRRDRNDLPEEVKFYRHLASFVIVNFALLMASEGESFPIIFFWGIGLFFHYLKTFGIGRDKILSQEWEDQKKEEHQSRKGRRSSSYEEQVDEELELRPLEKEKKQTWNENDLV